MAKGVHARRPHDEVQAGRKQGRNQQINQQHRGVRRTRGKPRHDHQHQAQQGRSHQVGFTGRAQRLLTQAHIPTRGLRFAQQAPRTPYQHDGHHHKVHHQGELGKRNCDTEHIDHAQPNAHGLDFGDQQRRHIGTWNRSHATHNHHHKRCADDVQIHFQIRRFTRQLQGPAQTGQQRAQSEHSGKQPGLIDAQGADHLAILRCRPHQGAQAGTGEQQPQQG